MADDSCHAAIEPTGEVGCHGTAASTALHVAFIALHAASIALHVAPVSLDAAANTLLTAPIALHTALQTACIALMLHLSSFMLHVMP